MIVAIHQPNAMPWLGYFEKIRNCDQFVLLDHVPFSKGSYTNRVQILTQRGPEWLTIPVKTADKLNQPIQLVQVVPGWEKKFLGKLQDAYRKAPAFRYVFPQLEYMIKEVLSQVKHLATINQVLISYLWVTMGGRKVNLIRSSGLKIDLSATATDMLISICKAVGGDVYLCGQGAGKYQDDDLFDEAEIEVLRQAYTNPPYKQHNSDKFIAGMSAIDYVMNADPKELVL